MTDKTQLKYLKSTGKIVLQTEGSKTVRDVSVEAETLVVEKLIDDYKIVFIKSADANNRIV